MISKNTIWYHIFIDRFAGFKSADGDDKPKFIGGNIKGIIDKLDYFADLGIDVLLLSPFSKSSVYHGYHTVDYESVDPHFGDWNDLKNLIHLAHSKNIKIIADFVPNHCSYNHPYFIDSQLNKSSKYKYWFYYKNWPENYLCFLNHRDLPKLNLHNPETANYLMQIAIKWCRMGIDGIRIDHVIGLPDDFIKRLSTVLKSINNDFILIGEAWLDGIKYKYLNTLGFKGKHRIRKSKNPQLEIQQHYDGILDGVLNFDFQSKLVSLVSNNKTIKQIHKSIKIDKGLYSSDYLLPVFLDNHDLNRFFYLCGNNMHKYMNTLEAIFTIEQPTVLYYGSEIPLTQKKLLSAEIPHADLMARQAMHWDKLNNELIIRLKQLIKQKKQLYD